VCVCVWEIPHSVQILYNLFSSLSSHSEIKCLEDRKLMQFHSEVQRTLHPKVQYGNEPNFPLLG